MLGDGAGVIWGDVETRKVNFGGEHVRSGWIFTNSSKSYRKRFTYLQKNFLFRIKKTIVIKQE